MKSICIGTFCILPCEKSHYESIDYIDSKNIITKRVNTFCLELLIEEIRMAIDYPKSYEEDSILAKNIVIKDNAIKFTNLTFREKYYLLMISGIILKRLNKTIGSIVYLKRKQNGYSHSSDLVYPIRFHELMDNDGMPIFAMSFESIDGISSFDTTKVITFINLIKEHLEEYPYCRSKRIHVTKGITKENTYLFVAPMSVYSIDSYCKSDKIAPKNLDDKEIELILNVIKHIIIHKSNVDINEENIIAEDGCVKFIKISTKQTNDIFLKSTDIMNNLEHIINSFMSVRIIYSMNVKLRKNIFTFKMDPRPFASRNIYIFFMEYGKFNNFKLIANVLNNFYFRYNDIERDSDKIDITTIVDPFVLSI